MGNKFQRALLIGSVVLLFPFATGAAQDAIPKGMLNARPATHLLKAWENRSLCVKDPPIIGGGGDCFDFKHFVDCEIWHFDAHRHMKRAGGGRCEVREFIVDKEPGHVPGDYGLIIGGIRQHLQRVVSTTRDRDDTDFCDARHIGRLDL